MNVKRYITFPGCIIMHKKNGFISMSTIYVFFFIFLLLLLLILSSYANNRQTLSKYKNHIKESYLEETFCSSITNFANYLLCISKNHSNNIFLEDDGNFHYEGENPNNYVEFGINTTNNKWRIIGVYELDDSSYVKLLNRTFLKTNNNYIYMGMTVPRFGNTVLYANVISTYNGTFIQNSNNQSKLAAKFTFPYIPDTANANYSSNHSSFDFYNFFFSGSYQYDDTLMSLLYPSDYGYAVKASDCSRETPLSNYSNRTCHEENWIFKDFIDDVYSKDSSAFEWFLTNSVDPYVLLNGGNVFRYGYGNSDGYVQTAIYLKSDVVFSGGSGTEADPYIIN